MHPNHSSSIFNPLIIGNAADDRNIEIRKVVTDKNSLFTRKRRPDRFNLQSKGVADHFLPKTGQYICAATLAKSHYDKLGRDKNRAPEKELREFPDGLKGRH